MDTRSTTSSFFAAAAAAATARLMSRGRRAPLLYAALAGYVFMRRRPDRTGLADTLYWASFALHPGARRSAPSDALATLAVPFLAALFARPRP